MDCLNRVVYRGAEAEVSDATHVAMFCSDFRTPDFCLPKWDELPLCSSVGEVLICFRQDSRFAPALLSSSAKGSPSARTTCHNPRLTDPAYPLPCRPGPDSASMWPRSRKR